MARIAVVEQYVGSHLMTVLDCANCGVVFGMTSEMRHTRRHDHATFWCPNGHENYYPQGETAKDRELREAKERAARAEADRDRAQRAREWAEKQARGANISAGKAKAAKARLEQRVQAGVCPCCHRTFRQLAAHMAMKHGTPAERRRAVEQQPRRKRAR